MAFLEKSHGTVTLHRQGDATRGHTIHGLSRTLMGFHGNGMAAVPGDFHDTAMGFHGTMAPQRTFMELVSRHYNYSA